MGNHGVSQELLLGLIGQSESHGCGGARAAGNAKPLLPQRMLEAGEGG